MTSGPLRESGTAVLVDVQAQPGARRDEVAGLHGGRVRVRTSAPPEGGRANESLARIIAEIMGVPRRRVELVHGQSSRRKTFAVAGLSLDAARERLAAAVVAEDAT